MDIFVAFGSRGNRSFATCATFKATNPPTVPIGTNVGAVAYLGILPRSCPNPWGSERSSNTGVAPVREFPPLSSATRPRSAGHPPSTSASASAAISSEGFDSIVDDVCDSYLDGCSVFSGISDDSDSDIDFSSVGSVKSPVRPASMETRRVENTPSHDAGKDIDVNNVNCNSSAASAVDGPAASFDVNNNIDSSPVNNNMSFTGPVTAANGGANGGPNTFSDLNFNAFSSTASAPLNVYSSSKVTAAASGASVNSNLKTVNTHCDSNNDANSSSNKTATATSSEDIHSISKTVDIVTTANSGVNVNILCESNIEVNSASNKSAAETSCGNVHSVSKTVNVEATANSGDSSLNVNVDSETTENGGVGANMSNDKAIDKGTVDSGAP